MVSNWFANINFIFFWSGIMIHTFLLQFLELPFFHKYLLNKCYLASTLLDQKKKSMLTGRQIFRGLIHKRKFRQESQRRGSLESVTLWAVGKHTLGMTGIFLPPQAWTCVCALTAWTPARTPGDRPWGQDTGHQDVPTLGTFSEQRALCALSFTPHTTQHGYRYPHFTDGKSEAWRGLS